MTEASPATTSKPCILIVGASAAGFNAAKSARALDTQCRVVLVSDEPVAPYHRPLVTELVARPDLAASASFQLAPSLDWFASNGIELLLDSAVTAVDMTTHTATLARGLSQPTSTTTEQLHFDKLVLATGCTCRPPAPDLPTVNVFAVRTAIDMARLQECLRTRSPEPQARLRLCVLGGGLASLELAQSFVSAGYQHVHVVEVAPTILPNQLPPEAAQLYRELVEAQGVHLHLGCTVSAITASEGKRAVESVTLTTGQVLDVDVLCYALGMQPVTALAEAAGCNILRGVVVDNRMQTSVPDVFCCGDCAQLTGAPAGCWQEAARQGSTAGHNAALQLQQAASAAPADAQMQEYVPQQRPYFLNAFGGVFSAGRVAGADCGGGRVMLWSMPAPGNCAVLEFDEGGALVGAVAVGRAARSKLQVQLNKLLREHANTSTALARLSQLFS